MTASLKFYSDKGTTETTDPSQVKYIRYTDGSSNEYSIDYVSDGKLKLGYQPSGGSLTENEIGLTTVNTSDFVKTDGLDKIFVEKLLEVKDGNDNALEKSLSNTFLKKDATEADVTGLLNKIATEDQKPITASELKTELVKAGNVTALTGSSDFTSKVYTKTDVDSTFLKVSELPTKIVEGSITTALSNTFLKKDATEADVTSLLSKITTEGNKLVKESEVYTKASADSTFLKTDATNFDSSKQADFLTKLGTNNTQVADKIAEKVATNTQVADKIAEKVATSIPSTTKTVLMSVIENHNEEGLVPSYDTLW